MRGAGDLARSRARDAFAHYLTIGREQGLAAPPPDERITERQAARSTSRADNLLPVASRGRSRFLLRRAPAVSVIMVLRDRFALTLMALAVRANYTGEIELILVDGGSSDETRDLGRFVRGARVLRFDGDLDFARAATRR